MTNLLNTVTLKYHLTVLVMCFPLSIPNSKAFHDDLRNLDPWQKVRLGPRKVQHANSVFHLWLQEQLNLMAENAV